MKELVEALHKSQGNVQLPQLTEDENMALNNGLLRLQEIGLRAKETGIRLLVDAEYTYMNPGISAAALAMMMDINQDDAVVANTYQCYLKVPQKRSIKYQGSDDLYSLIFFRKQGKLLMKR